MPLTVCPHCGKVQGMDRKSIGRELGCMNTHCERPFVALAYVPHQGPFSKIIFLFFIAFAIFLTTHFAESRYGVISYLGRMINVGF